MTTKKQLKAQERKRHEQLQRKIAERRARRARQWRYAAIVALVLGIAVLIFLAVRAGLTNDDEAASGTTPTPEATTTSDGQTEPIEEEPREADPDEPIQFGEGWGASPAPPDPEYAEGRTWTVELDTNQGVIAFELDGVAAPQAVSSFVSLARDGFFNQTDCHRLTTAGIFVLQCGDPLGTGAGGPSYRFGPIENAPAENFYPAGTLAMARQGGNAESMGSQFFIVYDDSTIPADGAGGYSVFGTVTDGLAIVEQVADGGTIQGSSDGRPVLSVIINGVSVS